MYMFMYMMYIVYSVLVHVVFLHVITYCSCSTCTHTICFSAVLSNLSGPSQLEWPPPHCPSALTERGSDGM